MQQPFFIVDILAFIMSVKFKQQLNILIIFIIKDKYALLNYSPNNNYNILRFLYN